MGVDRGFERFMRGQLGAGVRVDAHFVRICLDLDNAEFPMAALSKTGASPTGAQGRFLVLPSSEWVALPGESQDEFQHRIVDDLDWADEGRHIAYLRSNVVC